MLVDLNAYCSDRRKWSIHGLMDLETVCAIYNIKENVQSIESHLNTGGAYYTEAEYETYVEDKEYGDEFKCRTVKALRLSKHEQEA